MIGVAGVPAAIFDLDGTLLDGDSTGLWLRELLLRSPWRTALALLAAPAAGAMLRFPRLRRGGAATFLWLATVGMSEERLRESMAAFAERFHREATALRWRRAGIETLERHLGEGHRVAVVTAAPRALAAALLSPWSAQIEVFGSTLKARAGGWTADRYCRGPEKCRSLAEHGYGQRWSFAYTDSADDHPLLAGAERPFAVNPSEKLMARLRAQGIASIEGLTW